MAEPDSVDPENEGASVGYLRSLSTLDDRQKAAQSDDPFIESIERACTARWLSFLPGESGRSEGTRASGTDPHDEGLNQYSENVKQFIVDLCRRTGNKDVDFRKTVKLVGKTPETPPERHPPSTTDERRGTTGTPSHLYAFNGRGDVGDDAPPCDPRNKNTYIASRRAVCESLTLRDVPWAFQVFQFGRKYFPIHETNLNKTDQYRLSRGNKKKVFSHYVNSNREISENDVPNLQLSVNEPPTLFGHFGGRRNGPNAVSSLDVASKFNIAATKDPRICRKIEIQNRSLCSDHDKTSHPNASKDVKKPSFDSSSKNETPDLKVANDGKVWPKTNLLNIPGAVIRPKSRNETEVEKTEPLSADRSMIRPNNSNELAAFSNRDKLKKSTLVEECRFVKLGDLICNKNSSASDTCQPVLMKDGNLGNKDDLATQPVSGNDTEVAKTPNVSASISHRSDQNNINMNAAPSRESMINKSFAKVSVGKDEIDVSRQSNSLKEKDFCGRVKSVGEPGALKALDSRNDTRVEKASQVSVHCNSLKHRDNVTKTDVSSKQHAIKIPVFGNGPRVENETHCKWKKAFLSDGKVSNQFSSKLVAVKKPQSGNGTVVNKDLKVSDNASNLGDRKGVKNPVVTNKKRTVEKATSVNGSNDENKIDGSDKTSLKNDRKVSLLLDSVDATKKALEKKNGAQKVRKFFADVDSSNERNDFSDPAVSKKKEKVKKINVELNMEDKDEASVICNPGLMNGGTVLKQGGFVHKRASIKEAVNSNSKSVVNKSEDPRYKAIKPRITSDSGPINTPNIPKPFRMSEKIMKSTFTTKQISFQEPNRCVPRKIGTASEKVAVKKSAVRPSSAIQSCFVCVSDILKELMEKPSSDPLFVDPYRVKVRNFVKEEGFTNDTKFICRRTPGPKKGSQNKKKVPVIGCKENVAKVSKHVSNPKENLLDSGVPNCMNRPVFGSKLARWKIPKLNNKLGTVRKLSCVNNSDVSSQTFVKRKPGRPKKQSCVSEPRSANLDCTSDLEVMKESSLNNKPRIPKRQEDTMMLSADDVFTVNSQPTGSEFSVEINQVENSGSKRIRLDPSHNFVVAHKAMGSKLRVTNISSSVEDLSEKEDASFDRKITKNKKEKDNTTRLSGEIEPKLTYPEKNFPGQNISIDRNSIQRGKAEPEIDGKTELDNIIELLKGGDRSDKKATKGEVAATDEVAELGKLAKEQNLIHMSSENLETKKQHSAFKHCSDKNVTVERAVSAIKLKSSDVTKCDPRVRMSSGTEVKKDAETKYSSFQEKISTSDKTDRNKNKRKACSCGKQNANEVIPTKKKKMDTVKNTLEMEPHLSTDESTSKNITKEVEDRATENDARNQSMALNRNEVEERANQKSQQRFPTSDCKGPSITVEERQNKYRNEARTKNVETVDSVFMRDLETKEVQEVIDILLNNITTKDKDANFSSFGDTDKTNQNAVERTPQIVTSKNEEHGVKPNKFVTDLQERVRDDVPLNNSETKYKETKCSPFDGKISHTDKIDRDERKRKLLFYKKLKANKLSFRKMNKSRHIFAVKSLRSPDNTVTHEVGVSDIKSNPRTQTEYLNRDEVDASLTAFQSKLRAPSPSNAESPPTPAITVYKSQKESKSKNSTVNIGRADKEVKNDIVRKEAGENWDILLNKSYKEATSSSLEENILDTGKSDSNTVEQTLKISHVMSTEKFNNASAKDFVKSYKMMSDEDEMKKDQVFRDIRDYCIAKCKEANCSSRNQNVSDRSKADQNTQFSSQFVAFGKSQNKLKNEVRIKELVRANKKLMRNLERIDAQEVEDKSKNEESIVTPEKAFKSDQRKKAWEVQEDVQFNKIIKKFKTTKRSPFHKRISYTDKKDPHKEKRKLLYYKKLNAMKMNMIKNRPMDALKYLSAIKSPLNLDSLASRNLTEEVDVSDSRTDPRAVTEHLKRDGIKVPVSDCHAKEGALSSDITSHHLQETESPLTHVITVNEIQTETKSEKNTELMGKADKEVVNDLERVEVRNVLFNKSLSPYKEAKCSSPKKNISDTGDVTNTVEETQKSLHVMPVQKLMNNSNNKCTKNLVGYDKKIMSDYENKEDKVVIDIHINNCITKCNEANCSSLTENIFDTCNTDQNAVIKTKMSSRAIAFEKLLDKYKNKKDIARPNNKFMRDAQRKENRKVQYNVLLYNSIAKYKETNYWLFHKKISHTDKTDRDKCKRKLAYRKKLKEMKINLIKTKSMNASKCLSAIKSPLNPDSLASRNVPEEIDVSDIESNPKTVTEDLNRDEVNIPFANCQSKEKEPSPDGTESPLTLAITVDESQKENKSEKSIENIERVGKEEMNIDDCITKVKEANCENISDTGKTNQNAFVKKQMSSQVIALGKSHKNLKNEESAENLVNANKKMSDVEIINGQECKYIHLNKTIAYEKAKGSAFEESISDTNKMYQNEVEKTKISSQDMTVEASKNETKLEKDIVNPDTSITNDQRNRVREVHNVPLNNGTTEYKKIKYPTSVVEPDKAFMNVHSKKARSKTKYHETRCSLFSKNMSNTEKTDERNLLYYKKQRENKINLIKSRNRKESKCPSEIESPLSPDILVSEEVNVPDIESNPRSGYLNRDKVKVPLTDFQPEETTPPTSISESPLSYVTNVDDIHFQCDDIHLHNCATKCKRANCPYLNENISDARKSDENAVEKTKMSLEDIDFEKQIKLKNEASTVNRVRTKKKRMSYLEKIDEEEVVPLNNTITKYKRAKCSSFEENISDTDQNGAEKARTSSWVMTVPKPRNQSKNETNIVRPDKTFMSEERKNARKVRDDLILKNSITKYKETKCSPLDEIISDTENTDRRKRKRKLLHRKKLKADKIKSIHRDASKLLSEIKSPLSTDSVASRNVTKKEDISDIESNPRFPTECFYRNEMKVPLTDCKSKKGAPTTSYRNSAFTRAITVDELLDESKSKIIAQNTERSDDESMERKEDWKMRTVPANKNAARHHDLLKEELGLVRRAIASEQMQAAKANNLGIQKFLVYVVPSFLDPMVDSDETSGKSEELNRAKKLQSREYYASNYVYEDYKKLKEGETRHNVIQTSEIISSSDENAYETAGGPISKETRNYRKKLPTRKLLSCGSSGDSDRSSFNITSKNKLHYRNSTIKDNFSEEIRQKRKKLGIPKLPSSCSSVDSDPCPIYSTFENVPRHSDQIAEDSIRKSMRKGQKKHRAIKLPLRSSSEDSDCYLDSALGNYGQNKNRTVKRPILKKIKYMPNEVCTDEKVFKNAEEISSSENELDEYAIRRSFLVGSHTPLDTPPASPLESASKDYRKKRNQTVKSPLPKKMKYFSNKVCTSGKVIKKAEEKCSENEFDEYAANELFPIDPRTPLVTSPASPPHCEENKEEPSNPSNDTYFSILQSEVFEKKLKKLMHCWGVKAVETLQVSDDDGMDYRLPDNLDLLKDCNIRCRNQEHEIEMDASKSQCEQEKVTKSDDETEKREITFVDEAYSLPTNSREKINCELEEADTVVHQRAAEVETIFPQNLENDIQFGLGEDQTCLNRSENQPEVVTVSDTLYNSDDSVVLLYEYYTERAVEQMESHTHHGKELTGTGSEDTPRESELCPNVFSRDQDPDNRDNSHELNQVAHQMTYSDATAEYLGDITYPMLNDATHHEDVSHQMTYSEATGEYLGDITYPMLNDATHHEDVSHQMTYSEATGENIEDVTVNPIHGSIQSDEAGPSQTGVLDDASREKAHATEAEEARPSESHSRGSSNHSKDSENPQEKEDSIPGRKRSSRVIKTTDLEKYLMSIHKKRKELLISGSSSPVELDDARSDTRTQTRETSSGSEPDVEESPLHPNRGDQENMSDFKSDEDSCCDSNYDADDESASDSSSTSDRQHDPRDLKRNTGKGRLPKEAENTPGCSNRNATANSSKFSDIPVMGSALESSTRTRI